LRKHDEIHLNRGMGWPVWLRYGLIGGGVALIATLASDFAILIPRPSDLCRVGPVIIPLFMLGALFVFVLMAAAAGFASARAGAATTQASLAGIVVGAISGCASFLFAVFSSSVFHRVQELSTTCPDVGTITFGSTPPPGFVVPTPPPEAFAGPFGSPGIIGGLIAAVISIGVGIAIAYGAAALAAVIALATRPRSG
jgi:hypothetical protein